MRISDWSSDVCSSDLPRAPLPRIWGWRPARSAQPAPVPDGSSPPLRLRTWAVFLVALPASVAGCVARLRERLPLPLQLLPQEDGDGVHDDQESDRSEEHTSELQSLMRISYAVFCLKQQN